MNETPSMTKITLDSAACHQLECVTGSAEICDQHGQIVGYFISGTHKPGQLPPGFEVPLSVEETEKRRTVRTGRTLDEILRGLTPQ
jgi:hypothetical protein